MLSDAEQQQRRGRLRRFALAYRAKLTLLVLGLLVAFGLLIRWGIFAPVDPLNSALVGEWCRLGYEKAKTAADTATADRREPVVNQQTAAMPISCGELRRSGALARTNQN